MAASETDLLLPSKEEHSSGTKLKRRDIKCPFCICLLLIVACLIFMTTPSIWIRNRPPHQGQPYHSPHFAHRDISLNYTRRELINLDPSRDRFVGWVNEGVRIHEVLNFCSYKWNTTGKMTITRGDPEQRHPFIIDLSAAASSQMALDSIEISQRESSVDMRCNQSLPDDIARHLQDASIRLDVTIFVKPHTIHRNVPVMMFTIDANALDVEIAAGLHYEVSSMALRSAQGDIVSSEAGTPFTAHEIHLATGHGAIRGNWSFPAIMKLSTDILSYNRTGGGIDINLIPK